MGNAPSAQSRAPLAQRTSCGEWWIFDNTVAGAALSNALKLKSLWAQVQGKRRNESG